MDTQSNGPNSIAASSTADYRIHNDDNDVEPGGGAESAAVVDVETASASQHGDIPPRNSNPIGTAPRPATTSSRSSSFDKTTSLCANGLMILLVLAMVGAVVAFSVVFMINFLDSTDIGPTGIIVFVFFLIFLVCLVPRSLKSRARPMRRDLTDTELLKNVYQVERSASLRI